jgi:heme exporter protein B
MMGMSLLSYVLFSLILGNPSLQPGRFLLMVITGGVSMAFLFTMLSAIAGMAGGNSALIAILGFPLVVPQLILLSDLTRPLFEPRLIVGWWKYFGILISLDLLLLALSLVLFPFLWRE